ncbi:MAG: hotdog fold thioesterase [Bacteroidota bacterium]
MKTPKEIVDLMLKIDAFSQWLGVEILDIKLGFCVLKAKVTKHMLNGFSIAHGGISYSLADSALAFASNSRGNQAVSIETSISHIKKVLENDVLTATCIEVQRGKTIGRYRVEVKNQSNELIAIFNGTIHISDKIW